jgi:molybdenum cofactor synthesis domain-containing protein
MELNLFGKTEIWIENIILKNADLGEIASAVAEVLALKKEEVIVTDVRENRIVLDILRKTIHAEQIFGKKDELLKRLSEVPGVTVTTETDIHSEGILGLIALDKETAKKTIELSKQMINEIKNKIAKKVIIFPTGFEVKKGIIKDTNTPLLAERFEREGYNVTRGPPLDDDENQIASTILNAASMGYGVVIITGGVGAEDKDKTVEGILKVDPEAATPYIMKFDVGTGRHVKEGVRIAVGKIGETMVIALPGPTEEVKLCLEVVIQGLSQKLDKYTLADNIANVLRKRLIKMKHTLEPK